MKKKKKKKKRKKYKNLDKTTKFFVIITRLVLLGLLGIVLGYFVLRFGLEWYFVSSAKHLIGLEKKGRLSREYGYVWSEINLQKAMQDVNKRITGSYKLEKEDRKDKKIKIKKNIPSISAIKELNSLSKLSNIIRITDRNDYPLAEIKTTHNIIKLNKLDNLLLETLLFTEDKNFYTRNLAYEYNAFIRAFLVSLWRSLSSGRFIIPRGTSTIHQQVARFLLLKFDKKGFVYTEKSIWRKIKELKIAQALMLNYSHKEILEVYINHCINAGTGMTGYYDISVGLFGCSPEYLDTSRSLYLARLVKWNKNKPEKIIPEVKANLTRIGQHFGWDIDKIQSIKSSMDTLSFKKPHQIVTDHSHLIDLANEYWLRICRLNGMSESEIHDMNISKAGSLIRRKGNYRIQLHIDIRLQQLLESEVDKRGYGNDTILYTDIRIGSYGHDIDFDTLPADTMRLINVLQKDTSFKEPGSQYFTTLKQGDTLISNIRYRIKNNGTIRRSVFYYKRDKTLIEGQYYSYAIMNSLTGELLAYYSRDKLGSQLQALTKNRTPNGSAVAKPIIFALNYDLKNYDSISMISDFEEIGDSLPWARSFFVEKNDTIGMVYKKTQQEEEGYLVRNHHKKFDGYDYAFNHLARSNNIIAVEGMFRLNKILYDKAGKMIDNARTTVDLISRLNCSHIFNSSSGKRRISGPQIYSKIVDLVRTKEDTIKNGELKKSLKEDDCSYALGTLELTLFEQLHLFNVLYNNTIIERPVECPSLIIKNIYISGQKIDFIDNITKYNVFSDIKNIRPAQLGMHKRLLSNPADMLSEFDIQFSEEREKDRFFVTSKPLSNFAKSGTTDDIIRPYNKDANTTERTNFGLWNAVLRIELTRKDFLSLINNSKSSVKVDPNNYISELPKNEEFDITLACIGECNLEKTGHRDGKSLHKFMSNRILHKYGVKCKEGFYKKYEKHLYNCTPDSIRFKEILHKGELSSYKISRLIRRTKKDDLCKLEELCFIKIPILGLRLDRKSYLKLISYFPFYGERSKAYISLIDKLKKSRNTRNAKKLLEELSGFESDNAEKNIEIKTAVSFLEKNLDKFEK